MKPTPWRDTPVKTLLVDLDGTLLDAFDPGVRAEFIARAVWGLRKYGGVSGAIRCLKAVTDAVEKSESADLTNSERAARALAKAAGLPLAQADEVLREQIGGIFPKLKRYFYPVPGAREFIEWARVRHRLILATNPVWPLEQVHLRLSWAGIDPAVFDSITHAGRMHYCKPSEDYYRELLRQESLQAGECALVGDDVRKDLPAARVGISVFILSGDRKRVESFGGLARAACGSYADLRGLLA